MEKGTLVAAAITPVAAAEPAPTYTRNAVPRASARSFCGVVGGAAISGRPRPAPGASHLLRARWDLLETCSTWSNVVSRNISPGSPAGQEEEVRFRPACANSGGPGPRALAFRYSRWRDRTFCSPRRAAGNH